MSANEPSEDHFFGAENGQRKVAKTYINEFQNDREITTHLMVVDKQLRVARNGRSFLTLKLADKTGEITGRIWENAGETADRVPSKSVVRVRGRTEVFRDELQLNIADVAAVSLDEIDPSDFLPVCPLDGDALLGKFSRLAAGVKRRPLRRLLKHIQGDHELMERFRAAPAAKSMHHAYLGGLLEHSVSVAQVAMQLCDHFEERYEDLDRDLLLVGALLHDIGKIEEFEYTLFIDYSHSGRLLGHMILGLEILEDKIRSMKHFPQEEALLLKHLILSHHGQTELGAVKLPVTREAFLLHFADDLDAKMNSLTRILGESKNGDETWTAFQPLFNRFFFRGFPRTPEEAAGESQGSTASDLGRGGQLSLWKTMCRQGRNPEDRD